MSKYRSLPKVIEAIEFKWDADYEEEIQLRRIEGNKFQVWNDLHKSWINVSDGDMIRVDNAPEDVYPIKREIFDVTYELIEE